MVQNLRPFSLRKCQYFTDIPYFFLTQRGSSRASKENEKAIKRIISIAFCFVKGVALVPIFQNITQDVMPICSWYLTTTFLETSFSCQNRLSKPRIQAIFTTFYCNIKQLPWSDPRPERGLANREEHSRPCPCGDACLHNCTNIAWCLAGV